MIKENNQPFFAPQLFINNGVKDISFYKNAFGATENLHLSNDDGSLHVAELSINGAIFHLHEITANPNFQGRAHFGLASSPTFFTCCSSGLLVTEPWDSVAMRPSSVWSPVA